VVTASTIRADDLDIAWECALPGNGETRSNYAPEAKASIYSAVSSEIGSNGRKISADVSQSLAVSEPFVGYYDIRSTYTVFSGGAATVA
jgi:hypothetical protein